MKNGNMNIIDWISGILVVIGALNWGLFGLNLVTLILGDISLFELVPT